jgi:hypothetical protein
MSEEKQTPWGLILSVATIISAIAFLSKIFGKDESEMLDERGQQSRDDLYKRVKPSFEDYQYLDWAKKLNTALMLNSTEDEDAVYAVFNRFKMFSTQYITLPEAITEYFTKGEKAILNKILAKKRIDYQFE